MVVFFVLLWAHIIRNDIVVCVAMSRLLGNLEDSVLLPHISVAKEVRDKLGLPLWLAAKYTAVVFLLHVRFHVSGVFYGVIVVSYELHPPLLL